MALTWPIIGIVLFAATLHASWNALIKSGADKAVDTALMCIGGAVVALPFACWVGLPDPAAVPYLMLSLAIHIGYYVALVGAYRHGDLGLTYPIMRGMAPLIVAASSGALIGESPSAFAWLGVAGIAAGVCLVGLAHPGEALHHRRALAYAGTNAVIIAMYTLVDGRGVRLGGPAEHGALRYVLTLFALDGFAYPLLVWARRDATQRRALLDYARTRWALAALGGSASIGAYAIALWAMTQAPVASVAALRETSVLFAAALGTVLLKERFGFQRAAGTAIIVAGVIALRFA